MGSSDHVGLVANVSGTVINIIEGNCSDMVMYTSRQIDGKYIRGYGVPDYAAAKIGNSESVEGEPSENSGAIIIPVEKPMQPETLYNVTLPLLMIGDKGGYVKAAQTLLIAHGYDCGGRRFLGRENPDGEFGRATERAAAKFQREHSLEVDGEIGGFTWAALLCL
jgi:hypothetical protein